MDAPNSGHHAARTEEEFLRQTIFPDLFARVNANRIVVAGCGSAADGKRMVGFRFAAQDLFSDLQRHDLANSHLFWLCLDLYESVSR